MGENSTLFYNWNAIKADSKSNKDILDIIKNLVLTTNPINRKWSGKSFLLKPATLLNSNNITTDEIIQVLQIAATRNYFDYWFNGYLGAYLDFCGISEAKLKLNRFITIDNKNRLIHLVHEG